MMVPGSNILKQALTAISPQTVTYHKFKERTLNDARQFVSYYYPAKTLRGSWQPLSRKLIQSMGLDFQQSYVNFYVEARLLDIQRGVSGDQLTFQGSRWQVLSASPWYGVDGWVGVLCSAIGEVDLAR